MNMGHDLVRALAAAQKAGRADDVRDLASLLLDQAHILDGEVPADPASFARRMNALVMRGLPTDQASEKG
jgi:molecular chaperone HtpG